MHRGKRSILISAPTGSGKTCLTAHMLKAAQQKNKAAWFIVHRRELIKQSIREFNKVGVPHGVVSAGFLEAKRLPIQIAGIQTLIRRLNRYREPSLIIHDECFVGDVEILTDKGFIRFDKLNKNEIVAQVEDDGSICFISPEKFIEQRYDGKIIDFISDEKINISCTPKHDFIFRRTGCEKNLYKKDHAENMKLTWKLPVASWKKTKIIYKLSNFEKFLIALQADGSQRRNTLNHYCFEFSLTKDRKIKRLFDICLDENLYINEVKRYKRKRRFLIKSNLKATKNVFDFFDLTKISQEKARAIIEEMVCWDGHVSNESSYYYSSVNEKCVDFYQAVSVIAGYKSNKSIQIDNRKESYKNVHRLFIKKNINEITTQGVKKNIRDFNGKIYCVKVPSGKIIVRRNGKILITGNCHHCAAGSWKKIFEAFPQAFHIGLTATPMRLDGKGLGNYFDEIVYGPSVQWLIDNKFLSPYRIFAPAKPNTDNLHTRMGDFVTAELDTLVDRPTITGDAIKHYKKLCNGARAVVFCVSIKHSEHVVNQFNEAGIPAEHVDGETAPEKRDRAIKRFRSGEIKILSNVDLFGEGFDLPAMEAVIMLRPTQSLGLYLQQCGRSLRYVEGKTAIILDHAGNCERHGLPCEDRNWTLDKAMPYQKKSETDGLTVRVCPKCFAAQPSGQPICTFCGYEFPIASREIEQKDGELVEIDPAVLRRKRLRAQGQCKTIDDLVEEGKRRGYKRPRLWAQYVFNARQEKKLRGEL